MFNATVSLQIFFIFINQINLIELVSCLKLIVLPELKILQLIHTRQNRGAEIFTCQLSNHLQELGHQVKVVSLYGGDADLGFDGKIIFLRASKRKRFLDFFSWRRLFGIITEFNPDVVQANAGDTLKYAVLSKVLFGWKNPIVVRNASEVGRYITSSLHRSFNALLFKRVQWVISVSKASEKDILHNFPFLHGKTTVIGIGLEKVEKIKEYRFEPANRQHIVHVSGFTFEKNHFGILKIFRSVFLKNSTAYLHFIGDGELRNRVQKRAKQMQLDHSITFHGFVSNPLTYIKGADVLILPSVIEGLPGVLLEAMYCKTPVVAYDVGGISEIVNHRTGRLIPKHNEEAFADATLEVLSQPSKFQIESAYDMVIKNNMNEHIAKRFIDTYKKVK